MRIEIDVVAYVLLVLYFIKLFLLNTPVIKDEVCNVFDGGLTS